MTPDAPIPVLTPKQWRFVEEYLIDTCAGKAAIRAGYSKKTANQQGHILLSHPGIMAAIDAAKVARSERTEIDADWVLRRLAEEADADLADLYDDNNNLKPIESWPEIWRQGLVAGVEVEALFDGFGKDRKQIGYVKKLKLSDRVRRLELIGKHIQVQAFQETVNLKGLDTLADRLERAHRRTAPFALPDPSALPAPPALPTANVAPAVSPAEQSELAVMAASVEEARAEPTPPPSAPSPIPPAPADWNAPAHAYSPILPPAWPERPAFADCDYENFESGLLGSRNRT
jgi:phage terminase small subunit